ncbi:MAG: dephospho-CoA kinase [Syntrophaceae bacterium]|nr:dephospho-CoA kinase [Syntrophaceae bacterium]
MLNVGLTGGIACGKSTVAEMFVRLGAYLIDLDKLAHEVQEPGAPAWRKIIDYFGDDILGQDQKIDRNKVAAIVFNHPEKLQALNNIVHPCVYEEWQTRLKRIATSDPRAIVLSDIPLLFEARMQSSFDLTVVVMIPPEEQIVRLMARNGMTKEEAQKRIKNQMPIGDKVGLADIVINNQSSIADTQKRVHEVWRELIRREKEKTEISR